MKYLPLVLLILAAALVGLYAIKSPGTLLEGNTGFDDPVYVYDVSTTKYVGTGSTAVAAASAGRSYLEISNISGATTTAKTIYCAVGATATDYSGITILASSTRTWGREESVPVGAVNCISPGGAGATVTVVEK